MGEWIEFCERCGKKITSGNEVWLNLDSRTNTYTDKDIPSEYSQGGFPFGEDCAKKMLEK